MKWKYISSLKTRIYPKDFQMHQQSLDHSYCKWETSLKKFKNSKSVMILVVRLASSLIWKYRRWNKHSLCITVTQLFSYILQLYFRSLLVLAVINVNFQSNSIQIQFNFILYKITATGLLQKNGIILCNYMMYKREHTQNDWLLIPPPPPPPRPAPDFCATFAFWDILHHCIVLLTVELMWANHHGHHANRTELHHAAPHYFSSIES
jgi:hypothetical protein